MKLLHRSIVVAASLAGMFMFTACEWESGSQDNFNESQKTGTTNFSGFYEGQLSNSRAVSRTSGGSITHLTVQQSGRNFRVTDNNGSVYEGTAGEPFFDTDNRNSEEGRIADLITTTIQIGFEGFDKASGKNIQFSGVVLIEEGTFVELIPDGAGGFEEFTTAQVIKVIRGSWMEENGVNAEVLAQAERGF